MATVKLNPVFEGISRRMGDMVFYRRYGKTYVRRRALVNNPNTPAQQRARSAFRDAVKAWQGLDQAEQERWRGLGRSKNRTGYNMFISGYMRRNDREAETLFFQFSCPQSAPSQETISTLFFPFFLACDRALLVDTIRSLGETRSVNDTPILAVTDSFPSGVMTVLP